MFVYAYHSIEEALKEKAPPTISFIVDEFSTNNNDLKVCLAMAESLSKCTFFICEMAGNRKLSEQQALAQVIT